MGYYKEFNEGWFELTFHQVRHAIASLNREVTKPIVMNWRLCKTEGLLSEQLAHISICSAPLPNLFQFRL